MKILKDIEIDKEYQRKHGLPMVRIAKTSNNKLMLIFGFGSFAQGKDSAFISANRALWCEQQDVIAFWVLMLQGLQWLDENDELDEKGTEARAQIRRVFEKQ